MQPHPLGNYAPEKMHTVSGAVLNSLYRALRERTPVAGSNVKLREVDAGFEISAAAPAALDGGPFRTLYTGLGGRTYLLGGCLTLTSQQFVFPDYWVVDPITGPRGQEGELLVLRIFIKAYVADGVLLPGLTAVGQPEIYCPGTQVDPPYPTRRVPAPALPLDLPLGTYTEDGFQPWETGHRRASFCPYYLGYLQSFLKDVGA